MHKGEELEHIQSHQAGELEAADNRLRVANIWCRTVGSQAFARSLVGETDEHAVLVQPHRMARCHNEDRRTRQRQRGGRWGGLARLYGGRHRAGV